jgi:hypothetical protein
MVYLLLVMDRRHPNSNQVKISRSSIDNFECKLRMMLCLFPEHCINVRSKHVLEIFALTNTT